ncbi:PREDICTED: putative FBD-associated F-box protein At5g56700 [Brassica oleracea var. oleracea]|uniref:putative FBD-associated F-box protein At5g56700 n=1 Tax=Brassica oleracea var. oleracea TaxID=109376 RepID=UPI0006A73869|nr:PREDICTED: putative FBD-associated F-box protein At5g56700 [Brassica oleracea var. oleracea]
MTLATESDEHQQQERSFVLCYPNTSDLRYRDFIHKNLPLHRAPVIESLVLKSRNPQLFRPENIKLWVGIAVSRCVRELSLRICYDTIDNKPFVPLPSSLYTCCNSLTALKLKGESIFVDVPQSVNLPNLKTLKLRDVTYLNDDALRLLLSNCTALEDLFIDRHGDYDDNLRAVIVKVSTLQRLTLKTRSEYPSVQHVIVTPSLKYLKIYEDGDNLSYIIEDMPKLEEAVIDVAHFLDELLRSMTSVKHLSVRQITNLEEDQSKLNVGTVFHQLEDLKLCILREDWSKVLVWLLRNSPKLRVLNLYTDMHIRLSGKIGALFLNV